ncbi:preprotein translocase subunit SecG [Borrelia nietonii YOR]|uniref:preprotein translocase subunit SecG n=1 Tax=Borrelia nietonii TaxID=3117462 RepID=UPI001FF263DB|nr:preprotein translocase subunit SecG [Borrelia nietonii]UPA08796.1 preprotein translocase subunit SecG [Borrelia nietonii YOR]
MELFRFLIFVFFIITSFMIILLVLFQDEQGDGIGGVFGGGSSSIFGAKSSNIAIRITAFFITLFFIFVIALSFINTKRVDNSLLRDVKIDEKSSTFWNDDIKQNQETLDEDTSSKEK